MEILHSPSTKFRWELEWSVYFEWNQQVVYGDWETKMTLSYDTIGSQVLRLKHAEHLINTTAACVECDHYTAPPTGAPTSKPVRPKPKPKPTISPSPTPSKSSKSSKSLFTRDFEQDQDHQEGFWDEFESVDLLDNARDEEEWEAPRHSHLRNLHHKTAVRTHSPTMSPAPTLTLDEAFTTWEQIYLDGGDATGSRLGWDEAYNVDGYAIANIPMKYFISDKDGKHLYYEGTKCGTEAVYCWNDLPPGDRDYILRVGGAATLDDGTAETWKMCGQNGVKMQQLNFHVKDYITSNLNSDECDALMLVSRDTYCKNTLNLDVPVNGIIVLESLTLDSFSQNDLELLGHAISLIFSPTTLLEVVFQKHMHSSRGAHVGFTVEVPSSIFGLDATSFDTLNATGVDAIRLLKRADLSSSVDTLLLDYSALGLESNLHAHGKVYFEDLTIGDTVKATFVKNPYYYVDDDADLSEISLDGSQTAGDGDNSSVLEQIVNGIQNHPYSFLVLLMAVVVFVRRRSRGDEDDFDINAAAFSRHERKKSHAESLVKLPFSDKDRLGRTRESSSKKHRHESKDTSKKHKHRHSSEKKSHIERDTTSQPRVSASSTPTSIGTGELSSSSSDRDKYSQRFVPYGSAAELAEVEGWSTGRRAAGAAVTERRSQSQVSDLNALQPTSTHIPTEVEDEEYGDELDNILSHFESSTSSSDSSGDSDEWDHA